MVMGVEVPKIDRARGIVYFPCSEYEDCEECDNTACPLHPSHERDCFNCRYYEPPELGEDWGGEWGWCKRRKKVVWAYSTCPLFKPEKG